MINRHSLLRVLIFKASSSLLSLRQMLRLPPSRSHTFTDDDTVLE